MLWGQVVMKLKSSKNTNVENVHINLEKSIKSGRVLNVIVLPLKLLYFKAIVYVFLYVALA